MVIHGYFIGEYCWLFMAIILVAIGGIMLMTICCYILLMTIGGYFIHGYWWLFY